MNATLNAKLTWYAARASGMVGWALVTASIIWGLALSTRALGDRPRDSRDPSLPRHVLRFDVAAETWTPGSDATIHDDTLAVYDAIAPTRMNAAA